jgi:hypothetical protein
VPRGAERRQRGNSSQQPERDAGVAGVHVEGDDGVAPVVAELAQQRACDCAKTGNDSLLSTLLLSASS